MAEKAEPVEVGSLHSNLETAGDPGQEFPETRLEGIEAFHYRPVLPKDISFKNELGLPTQKEHPTVVKKFVTPADNYDTIL